MEHEKTLSIEGECLILVSAKSYLLLEAFFLVAFFLVAFFLVAFFFFVAMVKNKGYKNQSGLYSFF
ncbi:MAG TPA: hypothetical protein VJ184_02790 [Chryseolinea sp.]|nr:hypothetical protein [Chryseolinea sp.]